MICNLGDPMSLRHLVVVFSTLFSSTKTHTYTITHNQTYTHTPTSTPTPKPTPTIQQRTDVWQSFPLSHPTHLLCVLYHIPLSHPFITSLYHIPLSHPSITSHTLASMGCDRAHTKQVCACDVIEHTLAFNISQTWDVMDVECKCVKWVHVMWWNVECKCVHGMWWMQRLKKSLLCWLLRNVESKCVHGDAKIDLSLQSWHPSHNTCIWWMHSWHPSHNTCIFAFITSHTCIFAFITSSLHSSGSQHMHLCIHQCNIPCTHLLSTFLKSQHNSNFLPSIQQRTDVWQSLHPPYPTHTFAGNISQKSAQQSFSPLNPAANRRLINVGYKRRMEAKSDTVEAKISTT